MICNDQGSEVKEGRAFEGVDEMIYCNTGAGWSSSRS